MCRWRCGLDQSGANDVPHRLVGGDLPSDGNRSEHTSQAVGRERLRGQTRPQHKAIGLRITCCHPQRKWIATLRQYRRTRREHADGKAARLSEDLPTCHRRLPGTARAAVAIRARTGHRDGFNLPRLVGGETSGQRVSSAMDSPSAGPSQPTPAPALPIGRQPCMFGHSPKAACEGGVRKRAPGFMAGLHDGASWWDRSAAGSDRSKRIR